MSSIKRGLTFLACFWCFQSLKTIESSTALSVLPLVGGQFGSSVNPITTRGVDYAHPITASPPGFEKLAASLNFVTMRGSNQLSPLENRVTNECKGICRIENNEQVLLFPDNVWLLCRLWGGAEGKKFQLLNWIFSASLVGKSIRPLKYHN